MREVASAIHILRERPADGPEMRRHVRDRVIKRGQIVLADRSSLDCILLDVSEGGARVSLQAPAMLPLRATLRVLSLDGHTSRPVRICWLRGTQVGLEFIGPAVLA